jgi:SAM-dependent methyltransferase
MPPRMHADDLIPLECSVFFSFLHLRCRLPAGVERPQAVTLMRDGKPDNAERQRQRCVRACDGSAAEFALEAMIDRDAFPDRYAVQLQFRSGTEMISCADIVTRERDVHARTSMTEFRQMVAQWRDAHPGRRPALLDIGGRARSGHGLPPDFRACDVVTADIVADASVDVVTDIHQMSGDLGTDRFDFVTCISVFEHLLMPWKAVLEINKVLKPGGALLVQTHQTVGLHDFPWDYYRFSDESWKGLLNAQTGFRIVSTLMSGFQRIVPLNYYNVYPGFENAGGFNDSSVIACKVGGSALAWPVALRDVVGSQYPG